MSLQNARNYATFGIISASNKGAGAMLEPSSGVAKRLRRSLAMAGYTQLGFLEQTKRCRVCGETKSAAEFYRFGPQGRLNSYCKDCTRERSHHWYQANRERAAETGRKYKAAHRQEVTARQRAWVERNRDRVRANQRAFKDANKERLDKYFIEYRKRNADHIRTKAKDWYRDNTERAKDYQHRRRARVRVEETPETVAYMALISGDPCSYCGGSADTIDHIVPLARGGSHVSDNLAAACRLCNQRKQTNSLLRFLHRTGLQSSVLAKVDE